MIESIHPSSLPYNSPLLFLHLLHPLIALRIAMILSSSSHQTISAVPNTPQRMDPNAVAQSFVQHYYTIFDAGKDSIPQLGNLYRPQSMLTWETNNLQGPQAIVEKLTSMPFNTVQHRVTSISAQPSGVPNALLVAVNGELVIDNDQPIKFNQVWHLLQEGNSFWIHNDIFRLNY